VPTNGLSLVGFVRDRQVALSHLKSACIPGRKDEAQLAEDWEDARRRLGAPMSNAGSPVIRDLPESYQTYVQQPAISEALRAFAGVNFAFKIVEIAPLLAWQILIDSDHAATHCAKLSSPPTFDELLTLCLPIEPQRDNPLTFPSDNSFLLKSRSLNMQIRNKGIMNIQTGRQGPNGPELGPVVHVLGVQIGLLLPLVMVSRFNNRYYLSNGYHRAYGAMIRGAREMPCVVREVSTPKAVGIRDDTGLDLALLESANPPTLQHFIGSALPVSVRQKSRVITVHWNESVVFDEYD
jgi:hypothetical protein